MTYLISYFRTDDESMYLAASHDGFDFRPLNNGAPSLRGEVGSKTLRDPFIGWGPDGRYHFLATDGWSSTAIVHAVSEDLVEWSPQELVPVMGDIPGAKNAWAPEFFIDARSGIAHLIWSSVVDQHGQSRDWLTGSHEHRIWGTSTRDFSAFEQTRLFFDPGYSVIDATVQRLDGRYVMVFKDERGPNDVGTNYKNLAISGFVEPGSVFDPPTRLESTGGKHAPAEGPALFQRGNEWVLIFDHFMEGGYGALSTRDWQGWQPAEISLPPGMRHASVLRLIDAGLRQ